MDKMKVLGRAPEININRKTAVEHPRTRWFCHVLGDEFWRIEKSLAPTGIQIPDPPACILVIPTKLLRLLNNALCPAFRNVSGTVCRFHPGSEANPQR